MCQDLHSDMYECIWWSSKVAAWNSLQLVCCGQLCDGPCSTINPNQLHWPQETYKINVLQSIEQLDGESDHCNSSFTTKESQHVLCTTWYHKRHNALQADRLKPTVTGNGNNHCLKLHMQNGKASHNSRFHAQPNKALPTVFCASTRQFSDGERAHSFCTGRQAPCNNTKSPTTVIAMAKLSLSNIPSCSIASFHMASHTIGMHLVGIWTAVSDATDVDRPLLVKAKSTMTLQIYMCDLT